MDAIDRKILAVLQDNAALSVAEIGSRVGLSSTPCWKRIQRLEADGVIQKRVAIIDQDSIGLGISVFVSIETGDHSQDWLDKFAKTVTAMPEVMEFYRMAGDVDYMLRVVVPDIAGYDTFYKRLISTVALKNVTSRFAMEKIKSTTALPISSSVIELMAGRGSVRARSHRLRGAGHGFAENLVEHIRIVAEIDARRAVGVAAIRGARRAAIDINHVIGWRRHHDLLLQQHDAAVVEDDDIGAAIALAGDDGDTTGLDRHVGNQRIADHDRGGAYRKLE